MKPISVVGIRVQNDIECIHKIGNANIQCNANFKEIVVSMERLDGCV